MNALNIESLFTIDAAFDVDDQDAVYVRVAYASREYLLMICRPNVAGGYEDASGGAAIRINVGHDDNGHFYDAIESAELDFDAVEQLIIDRSHALPLLDLAVARADEIRAAREKLERDAQL
jgi:hypothetical protein